MPRKTNSDNCIHRPQWSQISYRGVSGLWVGGEGWVWVLWTFYRLEGTQEAETYTEGVSEAFPREGQCLFLVTVLQYVWLMHLLGEKVYLAQNCRKSTWQEPEAVTYIHPQSRAGRNALMHVSAQLTFSFSSIREANLKNHATHIQGGSSSHLI